MWLAVVSALNTTLRKDASRFEQMVLLGIVSSSFHQVLLRNSFSLAFPYQEWKVTELSVQGIFVSLRLVIRLSTKPASHFSPRPELGPLVSCC